MKKKLLSLTMALSIMSTMGATVFASDDVVNTTSEVVSATSVATLEVGVEQTYVEDDGTEIKYFLDENLMPYTIENSETVCIALPLEHLQVTDPLLLAELRGDVEESKISTMSTNGLLSTPFTENVNSTYYLSGAFTLENKYKSSVSLTNVKSNSTFKVNYYYSKDKGNTWFAYDTYDFSSTSTYKIFYLPAGTDSGKCGVTTITGTASYTITITAT